MKLRGLLAPAVAAVLIGGCGGHSSSAQTVATTARLRADIRALTIAAARHDLPGARAAAAGLNSDAAAAAATGSLSDTTLQSIRADADKVLADLVSLPSPTSSSPKASTVASTTVHTPTPTPSATPTATQPVSAQPRTSSPAVKPSKTHKPPKKHG